MEIIKNNVCQMYDIITVYGSIMVRDALDMIKCCDVNIMKETLEKMNMNNYVECINELLKIKI